MLDVVKCLVGVHKYKYSKSGNVRSCLSCGSLTIKRNGKWIPFKLRYRIEE